MDFRILEHTADTRVECRAPTFDALLATAARAFYAVALTETRDLADSERAIGLTAPDREQLLIRWLQELLYLLDVDHFVATEFDVRKIDGTTVEATARGYVHGPGQRADEIKAATYHDMAIHDTESGLIAHILFDL